MKGVSFRIRRKYFDQIVQGIKKEEVRRASEYWIKVMRRNPKVAVFICGKEVHRRNILGISRFSSAEIYFRRLLSEQGIKDIGLGEVIVFHLGNEIVKGGAE